MTLQRLMKGAVDFVLTDEEVATLLRATRSTGTYPDSRDHTLYTMAVGTGLAAPEAVELKVDTMFRGNGEPYRVVDLPWYSHGLEKNGTVEPPERSRRLVLGADVRKVLRWYRGIRDDVYGESRIREMFLQSTGEPVSVTSIKRGCDRWCERLGIAKKGRGYHSLRATGAVKLYERTKDIEATRRFWQYRSRIHSRWQRREMSEREYVGALSSLVPPL